jgi:hypothetical protein
MMEDAMLVHRIVRSSEKRIFYMNVGNIPPNEVDQFMEKSISKMKRTPYIDPATGDYNLKYNIIYFYKAIICIKFILSAIYFSALYNVHRK